MSHVFLATLGQRPAAITMALDVLSQQHHYEGVGILHTYPQHSDIAAALTELQDVFPTYFAGLPVHYHEMRLVDGTPLLDIENQHTAESYYLALLDVLYRYKQSRHQIHLLIAGGRKAMSVYATLAASLIFTAQDSVMTILSPVDMMQAGLYTAPPERLQDINLVQLPLLPTRLLPNAIPSWSIEDILALRRDPQERFLARLSKQETVLVEMLKLYPYETNVELALRLSKSERTIENQFRAIYQKMESLFEAHIDINHKRQALLDILLRP